MNYILTFWLLLFSYSFPIHIHFYAAESQNEEALKKIDFRVLSLLQGNTEQTAQSSSIQQLEETSFNTLPSHNQNPTPTTTVLVMFRNKEFQRSLQERLNRVAGTSSTLTRSARATEVKNILKQSLKQQQKRVLQNLDGLSVKSLWIAQAIKVEQADMNTVMSIAEDPMVTQIRPNERLSRTSQESSKSGGFGVEEDSIKIQLTWGLSKINAPDAWWKEGAKGKGTILGYIGTGVLASHESLAYNLHSEYPWFDAVSGRLEPYDNVGDGTHAIGTVVGRNGIGVAPESTFRACKGLFESQNGFYSDIFECTEWLMCPNEFESGNMGILEHTGACNGTPDVILNDWFDWAGRNIYEETINVLSAAGIFNIHPVSDLDSDCGTIKFPCDITGFHSTMCCGPVGYEDEPLQYSRGPSSRSGTIVPNVVCPGKDILSASNTGNGVYVRRTHTGSAAAHLAGTALLVAGECPGVIPTEIRNIIKTTTEQRYMAITDQICGGTASYEWPNFIMGFGRVRADKAARFAKQICERKRG